MIHPTPSSALLASLLSVGVIAGVAQASLNPSPVDLLEFRQRTTFAQTHHRALVEILHIRGASLHQSRHFKPDITHRAVLISSEGVVKALTPAKPFVGQNRARLRLGPDTPPVNVKLSWPQGLAQAECLLVEALPASPQAQRLMQEHHTLSWAPGSAADLREGTPAWVVERPMGLALRGVQAQPVLVDTRIGGRAPPPLGRFPVIPLRRAVGLPLLDAGGNILCIVFRDWGVEQREALCVGEDYARNMSASAGGNP